MRTNCLFILALLLACTEAAPRDGVAAVSHVEVHELPQFGPPMIDLLVILDDTLPIAAHLERLATLPEIIEQAYEATAGGVVDMRIAVTHDGSLRTAAGVGTSYVAVRTELDLTRTTNTTGTLRQGLVSVIALEATRDEPNQPLAALKRVLTENPAGFIREQASLAVVVISATDDASPAPVADYLALVDATKRRPSIIRVIATAPTPRLDAAISPNGSGHKVSLDDGDYAEAFSGLASTIRGIFPGLCWHASDVDPQTPGPQYDCTFTAMIRDQPRSLPPCKLDSDLMCWELVDSSAECSFESGTTLKPLLRPYHFFTFAPAFRAECVVLE